MGLVVNNNIPSLQTYNAVNATTSSLQKSIQKLSTGLRINSAADDAAGLAISEKMRAQIRGLDRAVANSQDGISMIQTAEGALSETHSILQRMRELSVQSANDTLTQQDRGYIQQEIDQLREEVTRIGNTTQFNKKKLLDGSAAALWSSDKLSTKALINGGLRTIDQFGQKSAAEGNFVIDINADPGKAQVQKSDVFTIKHKDVIMGVSVNEQAGINGVSVNNLPAGDYTVKLDKIDTRAAFRFNTVDSTTARYMADNLNLDFISAAAATVTGTPATLEVTEINATHVKIALTGGPGTTSGDLFFNIADGSLDTTASSTTLASMYGKEVSIGNTAFNGPIDVSKLLVANTPAGLTKGTTLTFTATDGSGSTYTGGGIVPKIADSTGTWGDFDIADPKPAAQKGEAYLLEAMAAEGVDSFRIEITATAADGAGSTAKLFIGTKEFIANAAISAGTASSLVFDNVSGGSVTLGTSKVGTATNLTAGDTWEQTYTVSKLGTITKGNSLSVGDYKDNIIFSTKDTSATAGHSIVLRKNVTANQFDVIVDGVAGTALTFASGISSTPATINIGGQSVNFTYGYGSLTATQIAAVNIGDEIHIDSSTAAKQVGRYGTKESVYVDTSAAKANASVLMEVVDVSDVNESVDFKVTANILNIDGTTTTRVANITLYNNDIKLNSTANDPMNLLGLDLTMNLDRALPTNGRMSDYYKAGDKLVYNVIPQSAPGAKGLTAFQIAGQQNEKWGSNWIQGANNGVTLEGRPLIYGVDANKINGQDVHLKNFYVNEKDGTVYTSDVTLSLAQDFSKKIGKAQIGDVLASFEAAYVGQVAKGDVKLRDLDKFWNSEGRFLLADAQTITVTQGDGSRTNVTLYATDTLKDAATKLNDAIAKQLKQQSVLDIEDGTKDPAASRFVTFVDEAKEGTSEALAGTFVVRSAIAGVNGEITFAGDEDLIKQLSLNEIQSSSENSFSVSVWDAHSGKSVASSVKITGNKMIGILNENVDVVFDAMANVKVQWNEPTRSFVLTKDTGSYQTILHLADNTTVFQVGANEGEDMGINVGDMRASALGLDGILVTDRKSAARSVTIVDNAIDKVSTQRAKLGAYQNRLEHTINNLTVAGENLTAAESRIRDTDMAKEMMNFTKLQIMLQAGTSMLAQANQLPQNILGLLR